MNSYELINDHDNFNFKPLTLLPTVRLLLVYYPTYMVQTHDFGTEVGLKVDQGPRFYNL